MRLIPHARRVALKAYSIWFGSYIPIIWLAVPEILWAWFDVQLSPVLVWCVAFVLASITFVLRLVDQGIETDREAG